MLACLCALNMPPASILLFGGSTLSLLCTPRLGPSVIGGGVTCATANLHGQGTNLKARVKEHRRQAHTMLLPLPCVLQAA